MTIINTRNNLNYVFFDKNTSSKSKNISEEKPFNKVLNEEIESNMNSIVQNSNPYSNYSFMKSNSIAKEISINPPVDNKITNNVKYNSESLFSYNLQEKGEQVFDLNETTGKLENKLAFSDVEIYKYDSGLTSFNCYLVQPNSDKLTKVQIYVPGYEDNEIMDKEQLKQTISKAIKMLDNELSLHSKLGDEIPNLIAAEIPYNKTTNQFDFKAHIDGFKSSLQDRITGNYPKGNELINYSVDQKTLKSVMEDFENFVLKIGVGDKE